MKKIITPAVVLQTMDMGESDLLVRLFTQKMGKIVGIAKGAKRSRKRFVNTFDIATFSHVKVYRPRGRELFLIEDAVLINTYENISSDTKSMVFASLILELILELSPEGEPSPELFEIVTSYLASLTELGAKDDLLFTYTLRTLKKLGIPPLLNICLRCGRADPKAYGGFFIPRAGGMVCTDCVNPLDQKICFSRGVVMAMSLALDFPKERLPSINYNSASKGEIKKALFAFLHHQIGKRMKSIDFIERYFE